MICNADKVFTRDSPRREVGSLNHRHFSFMGSITAPRRLISETAPQVATKLREDQVDAVFLVPV